MTRQRPTSERISVGQLPDLSDVGHLVEHASDIAIALDPSGVVAAISVNAANPALVALDHWVGRPVDTFLTGESREKLSLRRAEMEANPDKIPRPIELNHVDKASWEFPVRYSLHRVNGDGALLMLGRDMQPIAEVQQRLVKEQLARERDKQKARSEHTFFRVVLQASETPIVLVEVQRGRIRDLNAPAATLLGSSIDILSGGSFAQAFEGRRQNELMDALQAAATGDGAPGEVELVARRNGQVIKAVPDMFRAAGDLYLMCRLVAYDDTLSAVAESAHSLAALFAATSDAIVIADAKGVIREANEAFLVLADAAQMRDVRGRSFADFLVRGTVDLKLILDTATGKSRLRTYSAQFKSAVGTLANVEISAARLQQKANDLGYGLIVRDVSAKEVPGADGGGIVVGEEAMRNVMELVGSASLKDLVSATSDVVEKMCIETAVQLTGNNRVAAAEMLGLSRQSLYVKLRKYGLIQSSPDD